MAISSSVSKSSNQEYDDDGEIATVKVLPAVTLQIWASLLGRRGYQVSGTELIRTTSNAGPQTPKVLAKVEPGKSISSVFRRADSFAHAELEAESVGSSKQPFRRAATSTSVAKSAPPIHGIPAKNGESLTSVDLDVPSNAVVTIFSGNRFRALGEAKTTAVKNAIEKYGGQMVHADDEEVNFILVRLVRCVESFHQLCLVLTNS